MESFAKQLRRHRLALGLTQEDLAARAAISAHAVSSLERGSRTHPRPETVDALADALGLDAARRASLADSARRIRPPSESATGPRELPADIALLLGREDLLAGLSDLLTRVQPQSAVPRVVCVYGAAGVGKSAVAVRLGHRVAGSFPGGQLFVRLQDGSGVPVEAGATLGRLLRSLGVPPDRIPDGLEERSALLRSTAAGKAVLLVLDDVTDIGQVRPLLPASGRCAVIVTSRKPLIGLEAAVHRELGPLDAATSRELIVRTVPAVRDSAAVDDIVRQCAGLPLALRIVGARLAFSADYDVKDLAAALADDVHRLDRLVAGDLAVRTSLDLTLRVAGTAARDLFERLAVLGVDEFPAWVAAPLLGTGEAATGSALDELVSLRLIQLRRRDHLPGYGMHALVHSYSSERLAAADPSDRRAAERRYLDAVVRLATIADENVSHGNSLRLEVEFATGTAPRSGEAAAAAGAAWFEESLPLLRAACALAARTGAARHAATVAIRCNGYLALRDERVVRSDLLGTAREAALREGLVDLEAALDCDLFGAAAQDSTPPAQLRELADRCLDSANRLGLPQARATACRMAVIAATRNLDNDRALAALAELDAIIQQNPGLERMRVNVLDGRIDVLLSLGRVGEALPLMRRAIGLSPPASRQKAIRLVALCGALMETVPVTPAASADDLCEAIAVSREARQIVARTGDELGIGHLDIADAQIAIRARAFAEAESLLAEAADILARRPDPTGETRLRVAEAELQLANGRRAEARDTIQAAVRVFTAAGNRPAGDEVVRFGRALGLDVGLPADS